jgi:ElaB/YqjD/DUF883 family membrane-anchored ribosome-binding protein
MKRRLARLIECFQLEKKMTDVTAALKDTQTKLAQDFKAVVNDAEELLGHAADDAGHG